MGKYKKAYIYFDTNALECRHSGKALFLSQFTVNQIYFEIENLIQSMKLSDKVELCIPEIVWYELQEHLVAYYKSEKNSMEDKISSFQKSFGDLVEMTCKFNSCNTDIEYKTYVMSIVQDFLDNPKVNAKIIPCPKDENTIQRIIGQAIQSIKPFRRVKFNGKEYTDAGFKDALIFNTVLQYTDDQLGIFITNDNDFMDIFNEVEVTNLKICNNIKDIQGILSREFNVIATDMIEGILKTNTYLMRRILSECDIEENARVFDIKILICKDVEDDWHVHFTAIVNGIKTIFTIIYNNNANELIEAYCDIVEEDKKEENANDCTIG